jgi:2-keto-4-pentenoate hydratase/2-oxohepta-3-ene-1,7-dioic acid hydratase in catechol pathway
MKLATLKNGSRDGQLVVVSRDLTRYTDASFLVPTLQAALDNWARVSPHLEAMAQSLEVGSVPSLRFHEHDAESPLPRAFQWADGSTYVNHVELMRRARGAEIPDNFWNEPLIRQGGSDSFLGPRDAIVQPEEALGIDFEGEVAVIVDDLPAGAIVGGGAVSNKFESGPGKPVGQGGAGYSCIAEIRVVESMETGSAKTPFLRFGDKVRLEMKDSSGHSIFGAIEQTVESPSAENRGE